jgi:hypothetical protein
MKRVAVRIFTLVIISKEQAKTMIFSSTKQQKIVRTIITCTESTYLLLYKPAQKCSFRDTTPFKGEWKEENNDM